jgi:hypothetical protein
MSSYKVLELFNLALSKGRITAAEHEKLVIQAVHAHLNAPTGPAPPTETTEQTEEGAICTLRGDSFVAPPAPARMQARSDDTQWREKVTFDGHEWEIASADYEAKTGLRLNTWRKARSAGRYILRDGKPIYEVNPQAGARPVNVFNKANKLRIQNNKLEYKNPGYSSSHVGVINWTNGRWNVTQGR